jgi:hypothetical protein
MYRHLRVFGIFNRPGLDKRISYAIQIANQHPGAPILLSGGGFNIDMTEADV